MAKQPRLWRLDAAETTLLLLALDNKTIPEIIWFGSSLNELPDADSIVAMLDLPLPQAKLDNTVRLNLFPSSDSGLDINPSLRGHRQGTAFAHRFELEQIQEQPQQLTISLVAESAQLAVDLALSLIHI